MGSVEPVAEQDLDNSPRTMALVSRAREDFEAWVQMQISRNGSSVQIKFPDDWAALSFAIANFLPLSNMQKQHLLELTETSERFATLIPILAQQLSEQREPNYVRVYAQDLEDWVSNN
jgi:Lon protease-like protein